MSLYLPEWIGGPDQFLMFGDAAYDPKILCELKQGNNGVKTLASYVTVFNMEMLEDFMSSMDREFKSRFIIRVNTASKVLFDTIHLQKFIELNLREDYDYAKGDLKKTSEIISDQFSRLLFEFEFWNSVDVVEVYCNLIFYGVFTDPKPFIFLIPPQSEWGDYKNSWFGE